MKKSLPLLIVIFLFSMLTACGGNTSAPLPANDTDSVATIVAGTLSAIPSATPASSPTVALTAESPSAAPASSPPAALTLGSPSVLPRSLYYQVMDSANSKGQIYRLSRDGSTTTQITNEPEGVTYFDVSPLDGTIAYQSNRQILLADPNSGNRRVLVDDQVSSGPLWSPDGKTVAYGTKDGLYFFSIETGASTLAVGSNGDDQSYSPRDFSPDGSKLLVLALVNGTGMDHLGIFTIASRTISPLQPADGPSRFQLSGPGSWSTDSNYIYISDWVEAAGPSGMRFPGLWRYNADGTGVALLPLVTATGAGIYNKIAALRQDAAGNLTYLFSPPETGPSPFTPYSLVRSGADGVSNRVVLRPETFHVTDTSLWTPDGSAVIILQNNDTDNPVANLVLVPVDPSLSVVTLLADASRLGLNPLRWGQP